MYQADRSRRHLVQAANKKKSKRKSRVGSFSLLSSDKKSNPLQVSLHGNPSEQREQLGQRGQMCRQTCKATCLGFIGSVLVYLPLQSLPGNCVSTSNVQRHLLSGCRNKFSQKKKKCQQRTLLCVGFHFQVIRARRQVKMDPAKRNSNRSGAFSVLVSHQHVEINLPTHKCTSSDENSHTVCFCALQGDPLNEGQEERPKRSV